MSYWRSARSARPDALRRRYAAGAMAHRCARHNAGLRRSMNPKSPASSLPRITPAFLVHRLFDFHLRWMSEAARLASGPADGSATCPDCHADAPIPPREQWLSIDGLETAPRLQSFRCPHCRTRIYLIAVSEQDRADDARRDAREDSENQVPNRAQRAAGS